MKTQLLFLLGLALTNASLTSYNIDINDTTVSGLSAGGFMAVQMHYAFSESITGAAIFAGGPFLCSKGSLTTATTTCMSSPLLLNVSSLEEEASLMAKEGKIDSLDGLKGDKVYIYSGESDTVVKTGVVKGAAKMYEHFGAEVTTEYNINSEHCFPTNDFGNTCRRLGSPYISNCDYNGAESAFKVLYGDALKPAVAQVASNLMEFSQGPYEKTLKNISMGSTGYVYVPTACQNGTKCSLHIALHGCQQTLADIGKDYVTKLGLNELAEANNIVVLYPQVKKSYVMPSNAEGCWDWWGYTTPGLLPISNKKDFVTKKGPQMAAVWNMAKALSKTTPSENNIELLLESF